MGRGRQRAKEKKIARRLKYYTPETDYEALQRELSARNQQSDEDRYAELAAQYNDFDDDDFSDSDSAAQL